MKVLADFAIESDLRVATDGEALHLKHPDNRYELRLRNAKSSDQDPAPLRLQLIFETETLSAAKEVCIDYLVDALNLLSFVTNSRFEFDRIVQIIDWTPGRKEREALIFAKEEVPEETQSILDRSLFTSAEILLRGKYNTVIASALRWFRLGVGSMSLEEQFQNFWFALELVAEDQKQASKVYDACPRCRGKLYCETCKEHPMHRPYPKQAIAQLVRELAPTPTDLFETFSKARNVLLHGGRLKDVEIPCTPEKLVDLAGTVTWTALYRTLCRSIPPEHLPANFAFAFTNKYSRMRISGAAALAISVPLTEHGTPDIDKFSDLGVKIRFMTRSEA